MGITIENEGILITECSHTLPHEAHSWRTGFLWHRKNTCSGLSKEQSDMLLNPPKRQEWLYSYCEADVQATADLYKSLFSFDEAHRHYYGFYPEKSDALVMVWRCLDPFCEEEYSQYRSLFNFQTRTNKSYWLSFWR
jgi:hypothetical protein